MSKTSNYIRNESGFILPFTVLTITIVLFSLTTLLFLYEQEMIMTANIKDQFVIESLFSLAQYEKITNLTEDEPLPEPLTFNFSQGTVHMRYQPMTTYFRIYYDIETTNGGFYSLYQIYPWDLKQEEVNE